MRQHEIHGEQLRGVVGMTRLGDVSDMLVGFAFKSEGFQDADSDGVRLLRGDNVQQGYIRWGDKTKKWPSAQCDNLNRYQLAENDVILAMDRPIVGDGLKIAWIKSDDLPVLLVQRVCRIRGKEGMALTNFIRYVLAAPNFSAHIHRITTGANIPHISGKDIAAYEFELPSLDDQARIVECLSAYDDLIETNRRRIALLEESARLLYREWFVQLRFPGHESVLVRDGMPVGWQLKPLADIAPLSYGKALKASDRKKGEVPVYGSSGIVGTHDAALLDGGAIIVGRKGNVGSLFYSQIPCFPIDTVFYIAPAQASYWLFLALHQLNFISSDAAVPGLNRTYAHSLPIVLPSKEVTTAFERLVQPMFEQSYNLIKQNEQLASARDALLPQLMSGQLDVSSLPLHAAVAL